MKARSLWQSTVLLYFLCTLSLLSYVEGTIYFKDLVASVLERHIQSSRHLPICILFRKSANDVSSLEKCLHSLWKNQTTSYKDWQFGSYSFDKNEMLREIRPEVMPVVKCYLGQTSSFIYNGKSKKKKLHQWLTKLVKQHEEQLQDATPELVRVAIDTKNTTILAFPDHHNHHDVEERVFQLSENIPNCKAYVIHPHSIHARDLQDIHNVTNIPAIVVFTKDKLKKGQVVKRIFAQHHLRSSMLEVHLKTWQIAHLHHFTEEEFEKNVMTLRGTRYIPKIITFYAYWGRSVIPYLSAYDRSVEEFSSLGVDVLFGVVDLTQEMSKKLVSKWIQRELARKVPFTILFHTDPRNSELLQVGLSEDRPTLTAVYELFQQSEVNITYRDGQLFGDFHPYGYVDPLHVSLRDEGPKGSMCHPWSHNQTDNMPVKKRETTLTNKPKQKKTKTAKSWHDKYGTETIDKKLHKFQGIPLLTSSAWSEVIEKSHAPSHPLLGGNHWAGEVTKVALVVFVKADCRSCSNSLETFHQLQKSIRFIEGGSFYLVNCTTDKELCVTHNIKGYPYITAFRGLGWLGTSQCNGADNTYKNYVRLDYHGVIQGKPIMEWFTNVAGSSVVNRMFDLPTSQMEEDVRLISTLIPKQSRYLPRPPTHDYFFSFQCLRLACERLFGKAVCYTVYSTEIPEREYKDANLEMVVTKVVLQRRDGASAIITEFGKSLSSTVEDQPDSVLHKYHRQHRYNLRPNQKCEDDHAVCTDIITSFTLDHSRLPVTHITSDSFHTQERSEDDDLPLLIALVHPSNISEGSSLFQALQEVAYELYDKLIVATLDVNQYPAWAGQFVPQDYKKIMIKEDGDIEELFTFPRICYVFRKDHRKAAFYPPLKNNYSHSDSSTERKTNQSRKSYRDRMKWFTKSSIQKFSEKVIASPEKYLISTEHF